MQLQKELAINLNDIKIEQSLTSYDVRISIIMPYCKLINHQEFGFRISTCLRCRWMAMVPQSNILDLEFTRLN